MKHPELLETLHADKKPGACSLCDGPIPPPLRRDGRRRKICGLEECVKTYHRLHRALLRDGAK